MKSGPPFPGQTGSAGTAEAGGESLPFTIQAEAGPTTLEEATASGLFDMPDKPGMVRIPITVNVMIPAHLLPPADHDLPRPRGGVPPGPDGRPPGRRFGNYPRGIAARNVMGSSRSQMSPATVAPVPDLPAAVVAATGRSANTSAANVTAGSTGGLLDAGAQAELRGLALAAGQDAAAGGPVGAAVAGILWPTPTAMDDRPLAVRELAKKRSRSGGLEAKRDKASAFTPSAPSGQLQGTPVPALPPPLPGLTPPDPLPPLAGFTPGSTPIHTTQSGTPPGRASLANAQVHIAPEVRAASNILERNELGRRMEDAGTVAPDEVAHHIVPGGGRQSGRRNPEPAQKALSDLGVDLHDPANGVGLSAGFHNKIHTSGYYDEINRRLLRTENRERAGDILQRLRQDLKQADSDYQQTGNLPKWIRKKK